ncbi:GGDEF domain-containing protein [Actinoplanes bogorensis]|uniref:GGDEF domain-containing protein n=1 Tax=Paractinoplanes bogorensis TaxID=1610840 RepID=A0ABS5Z0M5_9ACTN|nr:GGDEF domain-containing protein [Actinoplanes bogorensis]MBU2669061.1 GGDEF domain-containing protein [Actinoplanes bogorensis]
MGDSAQGGTRGVLSLLRRDRYLLGSLGWTALVFVLFAVFAGHTVWQVRVFWMFQPALDLMLALCSWRVAELAAGAIRRFWRVLTAVGVLFLIGDSTQAVSTFLPGEWSTTGGTVQTVCLGLGLTSVLVAMLAHPHPNRSGRDRLGFWLDSTTVFVAGGVVAWCVLATPGGNTATEMLTVLAATGVTITASFASVRMILSGNAPMHKLAAIPMICAAAVMSVVMFLPPSSTPALFVGFLPSLLISVGPRIQQILASGGRSAFGERRRKPYSLLPYGAMVVAFGVLAFTLPGGVNARLWGVVVGLALICGLVAWRQLVAFHDNQALIARLREHEGRLRHQAHFDGLTGLANRGHFHDQVEQALTGSPASVSVLLVDLDGFKAVNDTMGHAAGDALLIAVADRLRGSLRTGDVPARLGGDEFAVLLTECTPEEAEQTAARILEALSAAGAAASIGIAAAGPDTVVSSLLREADVAMYAAKRQGKGTWLRHHAGMFDMMPG